MEVKTTGIPESRTFGAMYNWTELLEHFSLCSHELNENIMRVANFFFYLIIFVGGLVGNLLVLCVNWHSRKSWSGINIYFLNMAIADLGVVLSLPFWMLEVMLEYTWLWGGFFCWFAQYFYYANMYASIFLLTALSVDRYLTTVSTSLCWRQHQKQIRKWLCITIWVLAAILPVPEVIHYEMTTIIEPVCFFMAPNAHWGLATTLLNIILGFLIPFPIIASFNIITAKYIKSSIKPESQRERRLMYAYTIVFFVNWLPYQSMLFLHVLSVFNISFRCYKLNILVFFHDFIECFSFLHCLVNPFLYNFFSKNFQEKLIMAVVKYARKERLTQNGGEEATSSTAHSIVIRKASLENNSLMNADVE